MMLKNTVEQHAAQIHKKNFCCRARKTQAYQNWLQSQGQQDTKYYVRIRSVVKIEVRKEKKNNSD